MIIRQTAGVPDTFTKIVYQSNLHNTGSIIWVLIVYSIPADFSSEISAGIFCFFSDVTSFHASPQGYQIGRQTKNKKVFQKRLFDGLPKAKR